MIGEIIFVTCKPKSGGVSDVNSFVARANVEMCRIRRSRDVVRDKIKRRMLGGLGACVCDFQAGFSVARCCSVSDRMNPSVSCLCC